MASETIANALLNFISREINKKMTVEYHCMTCRIPQKCEFLSEINDFISLKYLSRKYPAINVTNGDVY